MSLLAALSLAAAVAPAPSPSPVVASVPASAFLGASHVRTVVLARDAGAVAVTARRRCGPGATLTVTVDRHVALRRRVTARTARTLRVALVVPEGRRRIALTVTGGRSARCRAPLRFGAVRLLVAATPPLAPVPALPVAPPPGTTAPEDVAATSAPAAAAPAAALVPAPVPARPARPRLAWAPPALTAPTTIAVPQGDQTLTLDTTKDYILKLGASTHAGGLGIKGGRNVVLIGGRIAPPASTTRQVALGISGATGTVHVEGVWIDNPAGREFDGIQIDAPKATVQLENLRATGLRGSYTTNHTDVVQPWGGVARLRIDRLSADSNYQGIFNQPDLGPIGPVDLRHVDLTYDDTGARTGGYLLWLSDGCSAATTSLTEVYVKGRPGSTLGSTVWPPIGAATKCPAAIVSGLASWAGLPITGGVRWGPPPTGPFVTPSDAGTGYVSPGYG